MISHPHYHWKWVPTFHGGRNIDIFEGREHIAITFTEEDAKRIISALRDSCPVSTSFAESLKVAEAYNTKCQEKFQRENPCPKCGSHNTDIDWGTPMFCLDCKHEWLPEEMRK